MNINQSSGLKSNSSMAINNKLLRKKTSASRKLASSSQSMMGDTSDDDNELPRSRLAHRLERKLAKSNTELSRNECDISSAENTGILHDNDLFNVN